MAVVDVLSRGDEGDRVRGVQVADLCQRRLLRVTVQFGVVARLELGGLVAVRVEPLAEVVRGSRLLGPQVDLCVLPLNAPRPQPVHEDPLAVGLGRRVICPLHPVVAAHTARLFPLRPPHGSARLTV